MDERMRPRPAMSRSFRGDARWRDFFPPPQRQQAVAGLARSEVTMRGVDLSHPVLGRDPA